jgi:D-alanyl-D-alanine carboxypeptidase
MRQQASAVVRGGAVLVALATIGVVGTGHAQTRESAPVSNQRETLESRLSAITLAGAPGVAARFDEGPRHWTVAAGVGDLADRSPLSAQSRFRTGSVTKTFVASVALQLVDEGRLVLDAPVSTLLPGLLPDGDTITVRHLLGQRGGLHDYLDDPAIWESIRANKVVRPTDLVATATAQPLQFAPGTAWGYSNTNYIVAGLVIERVTGASLEAELQRRIFGPLGLGHTTFPTTSADIDGVHARGYLVPSPTEPLFDVTDINPSHAWAAGAVVSSADDISRFYRALLEGRVLSPDMLDAMFTTSPMPGSGRAYGLGLMRTSTPCGTFWGHDGKIPGYSTWSFHAEDGARSLTVMINMFPLPPAVEAAEEALQGMLCDPGSQS